MSVKIRQKVERQIIEKFVDDALAAGYRLAVSLERGYDLDEMLLGSTDKEAVMRAAMDGDECHIFVQPADGTTTTEDGRVNSIGWVYFVFGNDGWDVISDYSVNIDGLLKGALELSKQWSE